MGGFPHGKEARTPLPPATDLVQCVHPFTINLVSVVSRLDTLRIPGGSPRNRAPSILRPCRESERRTGQAKEARLIPEASPPRTHTGKARGRAGGRLPGALSEGSRRESNPGRNGAPGATGSKERHGGGESGWTARTLPHEAGRGGEMERTPRARLITSKGKVASTPSRTPRSGSRTDDLEDHPGKGRGKGEEGEGRENGRRRYHGDHPLYPYTTKTKL